LKTYRIKFSHLWAELENDKKLEAWEIAEIYKQPWQIELLLTPTDPSIFHQKPRENYDLFNQGYP